MSGGNQWRGFIGLAIAAVAWAEEVDAPATETGVRRPHSITHQNTVTGKTVQMKHWFHYWRAGILTRYDRSSKEITVSLYGRLVGKRITFWRLGLDPGEQVAAEVLVLVLIQEEQEAAGVLILVLRMRTSGKVLPLRGKILD